MRTTTHTYSVLEVSRRTYEEIAQKLHDAGYDHVFYDEMIDMQGIGLKMSDKINITKLSRRTVKTIGAVLDSNKRA